jgi:uncharacterized membrane protein
MSGNGRDGIVVKRCALLNLWHVRPGDSRTDVSLRAVAITLAVLFAVSFSVLLIRKHDSFQTRVYDLARFDQAIWNTLHGRFLFSTLLNESILGNHFSPYMALLSPLFLIWSDVRMLFVVQAVGMAVAGFLLHNIVRARHPVLALWFLLAFYLNPTLHEVTLYEFRRITLAVPYLALALYALYARKRRLMVLGFGLALLCKEDVGFIVFMVGLFVLLFQRDWKWGVPLMVLGAAWVVVVSLWIIPLYAPASDEPAVYPQLYYFDYLGDSYAEMARTLLRDPLILVRQLWDAERLQALWQLFLPLGIVLPFLAPDWALICVPTLGYLLLSNEPVLYRLEKWHPASILPVLFAAIGVSLIRLTESARHRAPHTSAPRLAASVATAVLLAATVAGYALYSPAPLGGRYQPSLYRVTEHDRLALNIVAAVPPDARVAAQVRYVPHLAHREHIYHYPWIVIGLESVDYLVLDRYSHPYPFLPDEVNREIDNLVADPAYAIELEADGIYLLRQGGEPLPFIPVDRIVDGTMALQRVDVATAVKLRQGDVQGILRAVDGEPIELQPGQEVRVSLYWRALAAPNAERTVSVRIVDSSGALVAQHDSLPGNGNKPTSWWREGWELRDVHHLVVPPADASSDADASSGEVRPGIGSLEVVVYDSQSLEIVPFDADDSGAGGSTSGDGAVNSLRVSTVLLK